MSLDMPHSGEDPQKAAAALESTTAAQDQREVERLLWQQQLLSRLIGGPLPRSVIVPQEGRVLDVGCGTGTWVCEMAHRYPSLEIIGIDNNASSIQQAQTLARDLPNATFLRRDMYHLEGEHLEAATFSLIHMRFLADDVLNEGYPQLLQRMTRLLKVGGRLISCEAELPLTSSRACDWLEAMLLRALIRQNRALAGGMTLRIGIVAWMLYWQWQAGLVLKDEQTYQLRISYGTKAHKAFCEQALRLGEQIRPLLVQAGVASDEQCKEVCQLMQREIQQWTFCGAWPLHLVIAVKRERSEVPLEVKQAMEQSAHAGYEEVKVSA
jgi:ubiquinone/menaquinone biosynthesis C-methylase UbiE